MLTTYHHLTRDQRCQIYALNKRGVTQTGIAVDIGVSQGTISRELLQNRWPLSVGIDGHFHRNALSPRQNNKTYAMESIIFLDIYLRLGSIIRTLQK